MPVLIVYHPKINTSCSVEGLPGVPLSVFHVLKNGCLVVIKCTRHKLGNNACPSEGIVVMPICHNKDCTHPPITIENNVVFPIKDGPWANAIKHRNKITCWEDIEGKVQDLANPHYKEDTCRFPDFDDPTAIPGDGWKPVRFPVMFTAEQPVSELSLREHVLVDRIQADATALPRSNQALDNLRKATADGQLDVLVHQRDQAIKDRDAALADKDRATQRSAALKARLDRSEDEKKTALLMQDTIRRQRGSSYSLIAKLDRKVLHLTRRLRQLIDWSVMDKSQPAFPLMAEDPTATDLVNIGAAPYPPGRVIFPAAVQPAVPAWAQQARRGRNPSRKVTTCGFRTTADPQDKVPTSLSSQASESEVC